MNVCYDFCSLFATFVIRYQPNICQAVEVSIAEHALNIKVSFYGHALTRNSPKRVEKAQMVPVFKKRYTHILENYSLFLNYPLQDAIIYHHH